ncbi:2-nitropropane dioxygenase-like protein [Striga asiatica]|uniref:2-nitropropane dioxygenase-like protein n=1 Tax=Striga asiatica TaxID=4170 RepID=A0A5A7R8J3_STRAF|nr:2-nitropropane dioxygenase-like protein [Striga asiatica]
MGWRGILGFEYGIVQASLGPDIFGPQLVAVVTNVVGLGLLSGPDRECDLALPGHGMQGSSILGTGSVVSSIGRTTLLSYCQSKGISCPEFLLDLEVGLRAP